MPERFGDNINDDSNGLRSPQLQSESSSTSSEPSSTVSTLRNRRKPSDPQPKPRLPTKPKPQPREALDLGVLRVDNCEESDFNGCYRENGQSIGKTAYSHLKDGKYEIFWRDGNFWRNGNWWLCWDNDYSYPAYKHPTSTGDQPPESGWVGYITDKPSNTRITFIAAAQRKAEKAEQAAAPPPSSVTMVNSMSTLNLSGEKWFKTWTDGVMNQVRSILRKLGSNPVRIHVFQVKGNVHSEYTNQEFPQLQEGLRQMFKNQSDFPADRFEDVVFTQVTIDDLEDELTFRTGTKSKNGITTKSFVIIASAPEIHQKTIEEIVGNHDGQLYVSLNYSAPNAFENM